MTKMRNEYVSHRQLCSFRTLSTISHNRISPGLNELRQYILWWLPRCALYFSNGKLSSICNVQIVKNLALNVFWICGLLIFQVLFLLLQCLRTELKWKSFSQTELPTLSDWIRPGIANGRNIGELREIPWRELLKANFKKNNGSSVLQYKLLKTPVDLSEQHFQRRNSRINGTRYTECSQSHNIISKNRNCERVVQKGDEFALWKCQKIARTQNSDGILKDFQLLFAASASIAKPFHRKRQILTNYMFFCISSLSEFRREKTEISNFI